MTDHKITRLFGPPGTGKTTTLSKRVTATVHERGSDSVLVTSFSTTAANEIKGRGLALPAQAVGTLHAHAYRTLEQPTIALDPDVIKDWNDRVPTGWRVTADARRSANPAEAKKPQMVALIGDETPLETDPEGSGTRVTGELGTGDALLAELDRLRAAGGSDPLAEAPAQVRAFAERWEEWKRDSNTYDFSDLINHSMLQALGGQKAPGNPQVLVVDEAQDMTPAEIELVMAWGQHAEHVVIALDDDQAIMEWRGGNATRLLDDDALTADYPERPHIVEELLDQSFRVPSSVHACAQQLIHTVSSRREKDYHPRTVVGAAFVAPTRMGDSATIDAVETMLNRGESVMILASCQYMLQPTLTELRHRGIPFGNRFRPQERQWNPLGASERGVSTTERVARYLAAHPSMDNPRLWTGDDVRAFMPLVNAKAAHLRRGAKTAIEQLPRGEVPWELISDLWAQTDEGRDQLDRAVEPDAAWLASVLLDSRERHAGYPLRVAALKGPSKLTDEPLLTIGTIHSTKGGEADHVFIDPSISGAAKKAFTNRDVRDSMSRLFYVALTRARITCRVLQPPTSQARSFINPRQLIPAHLEVQP